MRHEANYKIFYFLVKGSLLPKPVPYGGLPMLTIRVEKIGIKDAASFIDPFITVTVKGRHVFFNVKQRVFHLDTMLFFMSVKMALVKEEQGDEMMVAIIRLFFPFVVRIYMSLKKIRRFYINEKKKNTKKHKIQTFPKSNFK